MFVPASFVSVFCLLFLKHKKRNFINNKTPGFGSILTSQHEPDCRLTPKAMRLCPAGLAERRLAAGAIAAIRNGSSNNATNWLQHKILIITNKATKQNGPETNIETHKIIII